MSPFHLRVPVGSVWVVRERYFSGRLHVGVPPPTAPLWWAGFKPDGDSHGSYGSRYDLTFHTVKPSTHRPHHAKMSAPIIFNGLAHTGGALMRASATPLSFHCSIP